MISHHVVKFKDVVTLTLTFKRNGSLQNSEKY